MAKRKVTLPLLMEYAGGGARIAGALLIANALTLSAQDKNAEKNKKQAPGQPAAQQLPGRQAPGQPGAPQTPGRQVPGQPAAPQAPGQPAAAQAPGRQIPGQPAAPQAPGQPAAAQAPGRQIPGQPATLQAPGQPAAPQAPGAPGGRPSPFQPAQVGRPGAAPAPNGRPGEAQPQAPRTPFAHSPLPQGGHPGPVAGPRVRTANGSEIQRGADGRVREIHTPGGGLILHSPSGVRRVELTRPDGRIVVAIGHGGYIQRPMAFNGHPFIQRTYMVNGIATPRVYRSWAFGGRQYAIYQPLHFFRPEFYVWAFNPWPRAATYRWGWEAQPWSGYYAGYYTPYPSYAGPAFWLTDYVVSTTLAEAYQTHAGAPPVSYGPPAAMPDDARFAITREVQRELGQERVDQSMAGIYGPGAALPPPPLFTPNGPRTFLVAGDVPAYAGDVEVPLAEGAVLQLAATPAPGSEYAEVQVLASRGSACPRGSFVYVSTVDLQEMQNHMQATIDQGLEQMQPGHGMPGIPTPPPQTAGEADALYANAVQPDAAANDDINLAVREADQSEQGLGAL